MNPISTTTSLGMAEAEAAVRAALAEQGFGVLTEIDVAATLKQKIDVDRPPLKVLGACNPPLVHQALTVDPGAALMIPCNVVLEPTDAGTRVTAVNPRDIITEPALDSMATEAATRLQTALAALPA